MEQKMQATAGIDAQATMHQWYGDYWYSARSHKQPLNVAWESHLVLPQQHWLVLPIAVFDVKQLGICADFNLTQVFANEQNTKNENKKNAQNI